MDLLQATARCLAVLLKLSPHDRARVLSALHAVLDLTAPGEESRTITLKLTKQEERNDER